MQERQHHSWTRVTWKQASDTAKTNTPAINAEENGLQKTEHSLYEITNMRTEKEKYFTWCSCLAPQKWSAPLTAICPVCRWDCCQISYYSVNKPRTKSCAVQQKTYSSERGSLNGFKQSSYATFSCPRSYNWHQPLLCPTTLFFTKALQNRGNIAMKYLSYHARMYLFQSDPEKKACSTEERWEIGERTKLGKWRGAV